MFKPVTVRSLPDFRIHIAYADGINGEVDLAHLAGQGVFACWNERNVFENVSIGCDGQIRWTEGVELCADAIYLQLTGKSAAQAFSQGADLHA